LSRSRAADFPNRVPLKQCQLDQLGGLRDPAGNGEGVHGAKPIVEHRYIMGCTAAVRP
jgi:hypothetical protein